MQIAKNVRLFLKYLKNKGKVKQPVRKFALNFCHLLHGAIQYFFLVLLTMNLREETSTFPKAKVMDFSFIVVACLCFLPHFSRIP
jgi:hypothetical protein